MNKCFLTAAMLSGLLLMGGCGTTSESPHARAADMAHNSRNSLDWSGSYQGVLPCADCPGIEIVVTLNTDLTYQSRSRYQGRSDEVYSSSGAFTWNDAGSTVTLDGNGDEAARYFVAEGRLIRLALDGSRISGPLAEHYVLQKVEDRITEKYWKLIEINGQPVTGLEREPYLILKEKDARVVGFSGCNSVSGSYELKDMGRIRFTQVAATMMACAKGMEIEQALFKVLETVDNYSMHGDHLTLNKARMAPLARFEAVYLQ